MIRNGPPAAVAALLIAATPAVAQVALESATFGNLRARSIGPAVMSGRISAIAAVPRDPVTIYVGAASGGVWKSTDAGITFRPVFDDHTQSIGAIAVDPSQPDVVWVGTGESWVRNSVSVGTGVYTSTDGGETWRQVGLEDSERIAAIAVDPTDGRRVFVCATGHLWDPGGERGVYRTTDGGETWEAVLPGGEEIGCSDLAMDPEEPRILYAGLWHFRRWPWSFRSGGPGGGVFRSRDGGETWQELTRGLPEGERGRIAVAVAPSRPSTVYALVESKRTALYRSDDLGESWQETNASFQVSARPFYFARIAVDPTDHRRVYKPGLALSVSEDGGTSFTNPFIGPEASRVHGDHHALWIDPRNPRFLLLGTDGGLYVSHDRGRRWRHVGALPISQFYEVSVDLAWPYNVYGGLQDNGTWMGPSRASGGVQNRHWRNIGFGDGFHAFVDPNDPDFVYVEYQGGNLLRHRKSTGEIKEIRPYAGEGEPKLRFNWNTPIHVSPTSPGALYLGAQYLLRSRDRGESWERISPDLTTNDPAKQRQHESGGLTIDNSTAENHTTIYTIAESPRDGGIIWVGTDDGNLQVTRDSGRTWSNVSGNAPGVPPHTWVSHVEASPHGAETAFVTFDGHATGDMATYVFRTDDLGLTWTSLVTPALEGFAHVVKQDPVNPDLLFLGTEFGMFVTVDGGRQWARFENELPRRVPVRDLVVHPREHDLVVATHGRGIYIVDDVTPLRHLTAELLAADVALLPSRPAAMVLADRLQEFPGHDQFVGRNPAEAAAIVYYQRRRHLFGDLKIEIHDAAGELVSTLPGTKVRGINRVEWPMRLPPPKLPPATALVPGAAGPRVPEGIYTVRLVKGDEVREGAVTLVPDPRSPHPPDDRRLQQRTALELYRMVERLTYVVDAVIDLRDRARRLADSLDRRRGPGRRLAEYADRLDAYRRNLVSTSEAGWISGDEKLREDLAGLYGAVSGYDGRPTASQLRRRDVLERRLTDAEARFATLAGPDLSRVNRELGRARVAPLVPLTREDWARR